MADTVSELNWILEILRELGIQSDQPVELFCNSATTLHIAANPVYHEHTKHIEVECHLIREQIH